MTQRKKDPSAVNLNDLHVYDPGSMGWTDLSTPVSGTAPAPRNALGFAAIEDRLYVFGGSGDAGAFQHALCPCVSARMCNVTTIRV